MKARAGDRVRVRHRYGYGEAYGRWGTVVERQGKHRMLVLFDDDRGRCKLGIGKRTQVHDADVAEIAIVMQPKTT